MERQSEIAYRHNRNGVCHCLQDIEWLNTYIAQHEPGNYVLKELFSNLWPHFNRPRYFGRWFKLIVEQDLLRGIKINHKLSNGSWQYTVFESASKDLRLSLEIA